MYVKHTAAWVINGMHSYPVVSSIYTCLLVIHTIYSRICLLFLHNQNSLKAGGCNVLSGLQVLIIKRIVG